MMGTRPSAREVHQQHAHEAALARRRARELAEHEEKVRERERTRERGRLDALQPSSGRESGDFPGCVE